MRPFLIADKQDISRRGLISIIKEMNGGASIREVSNYRQLQNSLREEPMAVVVLDYSLFDFLSMSHFLNMKSGAKESSWLLFSYEPEEHFLRRVLLTDASFSVVLKQNNEKQVREALSRVAAGEVYWCDLAESVMKIPVAKDRMPDQLTASEKNILREIALGKTTKEIAYEKNLSFHTVNTHRRNIYQKLEVNSVNEATRYAFQAGLIDLMEYYI